MSSAYKFSFHAELKAELPPDSVAALDYLLGQIDVLPQRLPEHALFSHGMPARRFGKSYSNFPPYAYACTTWVERNTAGDISRRTIDLRLPSEKLEGIYEECLPFASWLSGLSARDGFAGSFHQTGDVDFKPTLLFIYKQELYLGDSNTAHSFTNDHAVSFNEAE